MYRSVSRLRVVQLTADGCDCIDEEKRRVHLCLAGTSENAPDWRYLRPLLHEGTRLNAIQPRREGTALSADLLIYEPDLLVDISAVAHCFESYGETPLTQLLHRLKPPAQSEAIVLGLLASQLLDEVVHTPSGRPYVESIHDFFSTHGLQIAITEISSRFHAEAQMQRQIIQHIIDNELPQQAPGFQREKAMLEPSFFSEMLGLQGRMDLLTTDFSVVLEQKAGRGAFVPGDQHSDTPVGRTEHRVQLLLYTLLLRTLPDSSDCIPVQQRRAYLLYSHYAHGLVQQHENRDLVLRAIRLRNLIAHQELCCADADGFNKLTALTAEDFNERHSTGKLWINYQRPQIEALLHPIREASETERAYYLRLLRFIAQEHKLAKLGVPGQEGSGFASKWKETLEEKRRAGNIFDSLTLEDLQTDERGRVADVRLRFAHNTNEASNFRNGDIVVLYAYAPSDEPDVRQAVVFRATIATIDTEGLTLHLRAAQTDARVLLRQQTMAWAVEHDFYESSFNALYLGMHAFLSAPQARRDLLMLCRKPEVDTSLTLNGDYGAFNTLALRAKQARDLFLIIGPPGTGKTSFGLMCCLLEELTETDARVLLMAFTNRAVDEICSKLQAHGIDFVRLGNKLTCAREFHDHLLEQLMRECPDVKSLRQRIVQARVVVGTTAALTVHQAMLQLRGFSLAIIDEASQLLEPHLAGLLSAQNDGQPAIRRFIMIGDHKQLPAVVAQSEQQSAVEEPILRAIGLTDCRRSLFERLLTRYATNPHVTYQLTRQGRMHREIAEFPNQMFYGGLLTEATPRQLQPLKTFLEKTDNDNWVRLFDRCRTAFFGIRAAEEDVTDKVNTAEARLIAAIVVAIYHRERPDFDPDKTVGIIVPYRNQITVIRHALQDYGIAALKEVCIDTVERYQGSQRRYIVYGFTVRKDSQLEFLTGSTFRDWDGTIVDRRLNVAMTRAEEQLFLVGNPDVMTKVALFDRLIQFFRERHCYVDVAEDRFSNDE